MPYNIDDTLAVGESGHVEHHEAMATAINDLDTRATALSTDKQDVATLTEVVQDIVGAMLVQGTNVTIAYNDTTGQTTISASGGAAATWGSITGTLSSQTDLNNALAGKISSFADPNADRIVFWDDSAGAYAALALGTGLSITGTTINGTAAPSSSSETVQGIVELATNAETITGSSTALATHPAGVTAAINNLVPTASETAQGKVELATTAEVNTGTDTARAVTPAGLKFARPAMTFVVTYSSPNWQYKGATITARPAEMQTGDVILFVGNPGGSLPAWAATNDIWTQG
jgi:hypothetical protein